MRPRASLFEAIMGAKSQERLPTSGSAWAQRAVA